MTRNLPKLIWALTAIVLLIGLIRVISTRHHRSADQKILLQKLHQ